MRAAERERLAGPEAGDDLEPLVEDAGTDASVGFLSQVREAGVALISDADAEHQPALGQLIHCRSLARQVPRPPAGERDHLDAEDDAAVRTAMAASAVQVFVVGRAGSPW